MSQFEIHSLSGEGSPHEQVDWRGVTRPVLLLLPEIDKILSIGHRVISRYGSGSGAGRIGAASSDMSASFRCRVMPSANLTYSVKWLWIGHIGTGRIVRVHDVVVIDELIVIQDACRHGVNSDGESWLVRGSSAG